MADIGDGGGGVEENKKGGGGKIIYCSPSTRVYTKIGSTTGQKFANCRCFQAGGIQRIFNYS